MLKRFMLVSLVIAPIVASLRDGVTAQIPPLADVSVAGRNGYGVEGKERK